MALRFAAALPFGALIVFAGSALAGPCEKGIYDANIALGRRLNSAAGPTAPESTAARLHHQPTPGTVAGAEARAGNLPPQEAEAASNDLEAARAADAKGDASACQQALADLRRRLGP